MAPEQVLENYGKPGKHSDIYTLGVILFELILDKRPYELTNEYSNVRKDYEYILSDSKYYEKIHKSMFYSTHNNLLAIDKRRRREISEIVTKALNKIPSCRYKTVGDMKNEVRDLMTGLVISFRFLFIARYILPVVLIGIMTTLLGFVINSNVIMEIGFRFSHFVIVIGSLSLFLYVSHYYKPARPILNSTLFFSYVIGVFASLIAGLLYAFGPLAITDIGSGYEPIWHLKLLRFMIPGVTIPLSYGFVFAIMTAKRNNDTFKVTKLSVIAWLSLALSVGILIRLSLNLPEYHSKYPEIWFFNQKQGDVRFENFILLAFISVTLIINFENWKCVINTKKRSSLTIRGFSFFSRLICSFSFIFLTGFLLSFLRWGVGLTPPGRNKIIVATFSVTIISVWGICCFSLFTGKHRFIKWIDRCYIAKRARIWRCSRRIEEARERYKDTRWFYD